MNVIENAVAGKRYSPGVAACPCSIRPLAKSRCELPLSTLAELNDAVASAKKAQVAWGNTRDERAGVMSVQGPCSLNMRDLAREISRTW